MWIISLFLIGIVLVISNNFLIEYGYIPSSQSTINFPISFSQYNSVCISKLSSSNDLGKASQLRTVSLSTFTMNHASTPDYYIAIGF